MRRLLSPGLLMLMATVGLVVPSGALLAQAPESAVLLERDTNGDTIVVLTGPGVSGADAFEIAIASGDGVPTGEDVSAGPGWTLIAESHVVAGRSLAVAAFAIDPPCDGMERCVLLVLDGAAGGDSADYELIQAQVLAAGEQLVTGAGSGDAAGPAGATSGDGGGQGQSENATEDADEGPRTGFVLFWFIGIAGALVAIAGVTIGGARWMWRRGDHAESPGEQSRGEPQEPLPGVDELLDRIIELGDSAGRTGDKRSTP